MDIFIQAVGGILLGLCYPGALKMIGSGNYISAFAAQISLGIFLSMWGKFIVKMKSGLSIAFPYDSVRSSDDGLVVRVVRPIA